MSMRKPSKKSARSSKANTETFGRRLVGMCAADRLQFAWEMYAPLGLRKDGRRVRKGLISKEQWLALVNTA